MVLDVAETVAYAPVTRVVVVAVVIDMMDSELTLNGRMTPMAKRNRTGRVDQWLVTEIARGDHAKMPQELSEHLEFTRVLFRSDRKSTRLNSSHRTVSRMTSSA